MCTTSVAGLNVSQISVSSEGLCVGVHSNGTSCEMLKCDGLLQPRPVGTAPLFVGFLEKGEAANAPNQQ